MPNVIKKNLSSIKYRLIVPIMCVLFVVFALMLVIITKITRENSIKQTKELCLSQARRIASKTDAYFNEARNIAYALSQSFLAQRNFQTKSRQLVLNTLHEVLSGKDSYYAIFTMWEENAFDNMDSEYGKKYGQKTGRFSASAYRVNDTIAYQNHNIKHSNSPAYLSDGGSDEFEDIYYAHPKASRHPMVTEPYLYSYTKSENDIVNMSSVVCPIIYEDSFLGVVGIDLDISVLKNVILKEPVSSNMYYSIISAEGALIAHPDSDIIGNKVDPLIEQSITEIQDSLKKKSYLVSEHYSGYHKKDMLQYFIPITITGIDSPWLVMVEIPKHKIFADSWKLSFIITAVSLFSLLLLMIIIYYLSNNIIQPITAIANFAQKLASGKLKTRINITRNDELGKLIETLHFMARELNNHRKHLKILVSEKTEELEAANEELTSLNEELYSKNRIINENNSELQATLQHLKDTQAHLVQADKMASLGILTAGVAHEINNPLNYIMGGITGIENYFTDNKIDKKKVNVYTDCIREGIERVSIIITGLNQLNRNTDAYDEICELHSIIDNCLTIINHQLKNRIEVFRSFYEEEFVILGNVGEIHQVFINVLVNACQAITDKGKIVIITRKIENAVCIEISDNGCGIEKENISHLTDPFFTTKDPGEGTGLGLSMVYNIVRAHEGKISFISEPNKGTIVKIELPTMVWEMDKK